MSKESRTKFAVKNIVYNVFNKILTLVLAFVSRSVFIWGFGVEYLGLNGLFADILNLLSMADLGFGIAMVYSFYEPLEKNDKIKLAGLVNFYKKTYNIIAAIVTIVGVMIMPLLPYLVNLETDIPLMYVYYLFALANVAASYLCVYKTSILTADQKNYIIVKISMIVNLIKTIAQILSIVLFKNYILYLAIGTIAVFINNIYASHIATKQYPYINCKYEVEKNEKKAIFRNLYSVFLYKASSVLLNATDNILISIIVGTIAVGYYSNYLLIQTNIINLYALLFTSLTASVGNVIITEGYKKRYEIFKCTQSVGFIMAGILVPCYTSLVNGFIYCWLGKNYVLDMYTVLAIGFNTYLACVLQPLWTYREATGLYNKTKWVMVICALLNILLSILLGKIYGIFGIIIASGISRISTYIWYEPKLLFKDYFNQKVSGYYVKMIINFMVVSIITLFTYGFSEKIKTSSFCGFVVKAILIFMFSTFVSIFVYRNSDGVIQIKRRAGTIIDSYRK